MKKLYTLALAALAATMGVSAQTMTFYLGNEPIKNGETILWDKYESEDSGDPDKPLEVVFEPSISLGADERMTNVTLVGTCSTGQTIQLCVAPSCKTGVTVTHTKVTIEKGVKIPLMFEYKDLFTSITEIPKNVTVNFEASNPMTPDATARFTLILNSDNASAATIEGGKSVTVVSDGIDYNLSSPAQLALYNALGATVTQKTVSGNGHFSTAGLKRGLYIFTVRGGGVNHSGKIYVK